MANLHDTELSMCTSTTSISDVIGGLSSFMMNYFKMKFPSGLFNETYIANSMNSNVLARGVAHNQKLPYFGMEVNFTNEETSMGVLPHNHTPQYFIAKKNRSTYYRTIFEDIDEDVRIYTVPNRMKVSFNFLLKFQTQLAAMDWMYYIQNNFELNGRNYVNGIRLPVAVPRYFTDRIRYKLGLDPSKAEDNQTLRDYFRKNSLGGITEVRNQSTGNATFMYEYITNIMLSYPQEASVDVNDIGMVIKDASVTFTIDAEIWCPGGFFLEIRDPMLLPMPPANPSSDTYTFNLILVQDRLPKVLDDGKYLIDMAKFVADQNAKVDHLDLKEILSKDLQQVLTAMDELPDFKMEALFEYVLYENQYVVDPDRYEIDYKKHILINNYPDSNVTYHIALYGHVDKLNQINDLIMTNKRYKVRKLLRQFQDEYESLQG